MIILSRKIFIFWGGLIVFCFLFLSCEDLAIADPEIELEEQEEPEPEPIADISFYRMSSDTVYTEDDLLISIENIPEGIVEIYTTLTIGNVECAFSRIPNVYHGSPSYEIDYDIDGFREEKGIKYEDSEPLTALARFTVSFDGEEQVLEQNMLIGPSDPSIDVSYERGDLIIETRSTLTWRIICDAPWVLFSNTFGSNSYNSWYKIVEVRFNENLATNGLNIANIYVKPSIGTGRHLVLERNFIVPISQIDWSKDSLDGTSLYGSTLQTGFENPGVNSIPWSISVDASNINITPESGTINGKTTQNIDFIIDKSGLDPGDYSFTATLTNENDNSTYLLPIAYRVQQPNLTASSSVRFTAGADYSEISLTNRGDAQLDWSAAFDDPTTEFLFCLSSNSGHLEAGESTQLTLTLDRDNLDNFGAINNAVTFTADGYNTVQTDISVTILPADIVINQTNVALNDNVRSYNLTVSNTGDNEGSWHITGVPEWMVVSKVFGVLQGGDSEQITLAYRNNRILNNDVCRPTYFYFSGDGNNFVQISVNSNLEPIRLQAVVLAQEDTGETGMLWPEVSLTTESVDHWGPSNLEASLELNSRSNDVYVKIINPSWRAAGMIIYTDGQYAPNYLWTHNYQMDGSWVGELIPPGSAQLIRFSHVNSTTTYAQLYIGEYDEILEAYLSHPYPSQLPSMGAVMSTSGYPFEAGLHLVFTVSGVYPVDPPVYDPNPPSPDNPIVVDPLPPDSSFPSPSNTSNALAVTWQSISGRWYADGPVQKLVTSWTTESEALDLVSSEANSFHFLSTWGNIRVWECLGDNLDSYDQDIRTKYDLP
jgi:hypothetical protein